MHFAHSMPFGAEVQDACVRFRIWAPMEQAPTLVVDAGAGERRLPMTRGQNGWFECITDAAAPGSRYLYELDSGRRVPDPASRFQPCDVHGPSEVIDPAGYAWRVPGWRGRPWREAILYELHVGAFAGDFDGVRRKLKHLAALGVTAVELMPLSDFEGRRNWGYDGVQPFAPDASYGRPESLKALIDAAHECGLMMFLDVVYNHFGPSGNYLGAYAPQFFTDAYRTPWGEAIDFAQAVVRNYFIHNALYWLDEYRFDGLRFDAADQIRDAGDPHILAEIASTIRLTHPDRHVHLVLENDANAARWLVRQGASPKWYDAQWNDDFHHAAHALVTGENGGYYMDYADAPAAALARALAEGYVYQGEFSAYRGRARGESCAPLPPLAFVNFLQNHDQIGNRAFGERLAAMADPQAVEALLAILLLAPSVPLLFMGEEWGANQPFLFFCDYHGELADAVREGRRREFGKFAPFFDPAARERLPDPNAESTVSASRLDWSAAESVAGSHRLAYVRELLAIRSRDIVPHLREDSHGGRYESLDACAFQVKWRLADGACLHLIANLAADTAVAADGSLPGRRLFATRNLAARSHPGDLPPYSVAWSCE